MDEIELPHLYKPYPHQEPLYKAMQSSIRRAVIVYHRRGGKDLTCWNIMIELAMCKKGVYYYIFPSYAQARKAFWDNITEDGRRYLDFIPTQLLSKKWENEMKLRLINGSMIQVLGSDNVDSLRGTNPAGVVLSEYAYQNPQIWKAILDPILQKNDGWAIFNSTPCGKNHFYDLFEYGKTDPKWYTGIFTIKDTNLISVEDIDAKKDQGLSQEMIAQEYYCSFASGVIGSYYGRYIEKAQAEGRITYLPYDERYLVHTAWDIGFSDATAIVWFQLVGNAIHIIDHYENNGFALSHYLGELRNRSYSYGINFLPHDGKHANIATGRSLINIANESEFNFEIISSKTSVLDGIEKVRGLFSRLFFDEDKCEYLLRCLQDYHAEYNEKAQVYAARPKHSWSSHSADSIRYLCLAVDNLNTSRMTEEDADAMERKYKKNLHAFS